MPARITANGDRVELYVPLTKFDERTGEFEAWATLQELDAHGEICDVEKSWPALVAHAQEQAEFSGGKSVGNLRRQHRRDSAIGKLTKMERKARNGVDGVFVVGKMTDPQSKVDAAEGVLTGISYRGMATRWADPEIEGAKRYAWTLVEEPSVVDRPAVPHALIEVMKSSGEVEMVKAAGRQVIQYWDCLNPACQSMHSRKEEAQKCEMPDEPLPSSVEATQKSAPLASVAETDVLLDKCLGCVAELGYLIQHATTERPPVECSGCNSSPCSGPPCVSYIDPGHEEMEAGVKQLWDAMRAMVNDLRAKWMREEGVIDTPVGEGEALLGTSVDVAKMLDAITGKLRDTKEVLKSLRVPSGNGSKSNQKEGTVKETKDTKKEEVAADTLVDTNAVTTIMTKLDEISGRLDAIEATQASQGKDIADLKAQLPTQEAQKAAGTKLEDIAATVKSHGEEVAAIGETVKSLAEVVGNLPTVPKGTLRAVDKERDGAADTSKSDENKPDPFSSTGGLIRRLA